LLLGVLLIAAAMSEGSAGNWLNLAVVEGFNTAESTGALAYATFVVAMLIVRALGAKLLEKFGRVRVLLTSTVSALAGLLLFTASPSLALAWIGIVFWGFGAAMAFPTVLGAAADDPKRAAARVSVVASFSSFSMLVAPPILGIFADAWGLRSALMLIVIPMAVALFVARAAASERVVGEDDHANPEEKEGFARIDSAPHPITEPLLTVSRDVEN
jgi:MFS family permease